jgi:hypothetical protein
MPIYPSNQLLSNTKRQIHVPNIRYSVGKDGESILKNRAQLSDVEMEKWARESYMDKKGFIRK